MKRDRHFYHNLLTLYAKWSLCRALIYYNPLLKAPWSIFKAHLLRLHFDFNLNTGIQRVNFQGVYGFLFLLWQTLALIGFVLYITAYLCQSKIYTKEYPYEEKGTGFRGFSRIHFMVLKQSQHLSRRCIELHETLKQIQILH